MKGYIYFFTAAFFDDLYSMLTFDQCRNFPVQFPVMYDVKFRVVKLWQESFLRINLLTVKKKQVQDKIISLLYNRLKELMFRHKKFKWEFGAQRKCVKSLGMHWKPEIWLGIDWEKILSSLYGVQVTWRNNLSSCKFWKILSSITYSSFRLNINHLLLLSIGRNWNFIKIGIVGINP